MTYKRTLKPRRGSFSHGNTKTESRKTYRSNRVNASSGSFSHSKNKHNSKTSNERSRFERIDFSRFISKATIIEKEEIYVPTNSFSDFAIMPRLKTAIANKNYIYP